MVMLHTMLPSTTSRLEMGYQKSILFAEMGKWYNKKVAQSKMVNVDCIIATSRVKTVLF